MLAITPLASISTSENTGEKPQSKLWEYAGQWWAALPDKDTVWISRLDGTTWTRVLSVGNSDSVHVDVKSIDGLTHLLLVNGNKTQFATIEYSSITNTYRPWALQPNVVTVGLPKGIETATIDVDSTGRMWVAYDQGSNVEVRYADGLYTNWSSPIIVASGISSDDISVVTAMPDGKIGVMWSNQKTKLFGFRYHVDGASPTEWSADESPASQSSLGKMADDHLNVAVTSDGTLYAAVKTSYDSSGKPAIALLVRRPNGQWDNLYPVDNSGTRPIVVVNEAANRLVVAYTSSEGGGNILYKESRLDLISFGARQTMISGSLNNVTSTKQNFEEGVVLVASGGSTAKAVYFSFDTAVPNQAPQVTAGPDRTVTLGTPASLDGTVSDDGGLASLSISWSKVSGPGTVTFGNASSVDTTATFTLAGTYVLRLTASDGIFSSSDTVTVVVNAPVSNSAPVVNAGQDQTLPFGVPVSLSGTVTDDGLPGSGIVTNWTRVSGPGSVTFANSASHNTTAQFSVAGTYVLRLTASDGQLSSSDEVTIVVQPLVQNQAPVVEAGGDLSAIVGVPINLSGSVVDDSPAGSMVYTWSRVSGPGTATFANAGALATSVTFSAAGSYVLRLTASDGQFSTSDTLTVTVGNASTPITASFQNGVGGYNGASDTMIRAKSANTAAGSATELSMDGSPDSAVLLAWKLASIPAGSMIESVTIDLYITNTSTLPYAVYAVQRAWDAATATWNQAAAGSPWSVAGAQGTGDRGPLVGQLVGTRSGVATFTLNAAGLALVQSWINNPDSNFGLMFQDYGSSNGLDIASSEASTVSQRPRINITYRTAADPTPNTAPVVNAGPDRSTTVGTAITLSGSATDDGQPSPLTATWTRVSGPGTVTFGSASSLTTTAQFSTPGTYVLRLTASDGSLSSSDEVTITVAAAPINQAPSVEAGSNQSVSLGTPVSLSGSISDDGLPAGSLTSTWTKVSGPGTVSFANSSNAVTTAQFSTAGTYVLRLTASDGQLSASDTVTIVVNAVPVNQAPSVDAGSDQSVSAGTTVNLNGTVGDDAFPGTNLTTSWTKVSGPGNVTFGNASLVDTTAQFSTPGTYVLRLTASDGLLSTSDTVTIVVTPLVVNQAPSVNAGSNLVVTVGANVLLDATVTDDGLPGPLSTQWTKISGPGSVQFVSASSVDTYVSFSAAGSYVLRLSASDGALSASDDITITVVSPSTPLVAEFQDGVAGYNGTRDTMIESGSSSGAGNATQLSMDGRPDSGVLLGWDLSSIPSGSIIVSASIELYVTNSSKDTYNAYAVNRAWDELAATWTRASASSNWSSAGAQGSADRSSSAIGQLSGSRTGTTTMVLNSLGLALVQAWIDDPSSNYGLIFQDYAASNGLDIASSEASNVSQRPKLKIEFEPPVVQHAPNNFFAYAQTSSPGDEQAIYPYGPNIAFGLYSVSGMNDFDPTKSNMQRVAEQGFSLVGPYHTTNWQADMALIQQAHSLGLKFIYQVRQHPTLNGLSAAARPGAIALLSDADISAVVRTQVETILNDPIARETVSFWTLQPEEIRYWIPEEMRYLRIASETVRQIEAERGETPRPIWVYEPNQRSASDLILTGQYQDVTSKGAYLTTQFDRGPQRAGWAMWSFQQIVEAATTLNNIPQAIFQLYEDFTDTATGTSASEITRVIRHDVYLGLVMGIKSLNVFSMFEDRPNLTTHNEQFEAYGSVARDLLGPLDLDRVLLTGEERSDLEISVVGGSDKFAYVHTDGSAHTFDFLHYRNIALEDERYIFLVNSNEASMQVDIAGLPGEYVVDDLFAGTSSTMTGTSMRVSLDVLGVKVLRLRKA